MIVLYGGIAAGKSTIGRRLADLGAVRIDADQLARDAVAPGSPGLNAVAQRFGEDLLLTDGSLDRARLGELVFGDQEALQDLNGIVHPEVRRLSSEALAAARAADPECVVVYEVPLLAELAPADRVTGDLVVLAEASIEERIRRMREFRGMSESDARARVANQATDEERRALADVVIDTGGTESQTIEQTDALWSKLTS